VVSYGAVAKSRVMAGPGIIVGCDVAESAIVMTLGGPLVGATVPIKSSVNDVGSVVVAKATVVVGAGFPDGARIVVGS